MIFKEDQPFEIGLNKLFSPIRKAFTSIDWKCVTAVFIAFIVTRVMIVTITYLSMAQIPLRDYPLLPRYNPRNIIADGLIRWDSDNYIRTAENGYSTTNLQATAFFPLYSILINLTSKITGNIWTSGLWVSNICFLIALFYLYALAKKEFDEETARRAVFYISAAPTAFFFSAVYNESVYLLLIVACFYYAREGKWIPAAIVGSLASATRLQGVYAGVIILLEALWLQGFRFFPKPWRLKSQINLIKKDFFCIPKAWKGIIAATFSFSGLAAYMIHLNSKVGDPLAFLHITSNYWGKGISVDWLPRLIQFVIDQHHEIGNLFSGEISGFQYLPDLAITVLLLPIIVIVVCKFRPAYGIFAVLSFLIPLMSGQTVSMMRYVLPIIPVYFLFALWGKKQWFDRLYIGVSLPLQAFFLILFSHWWYAG
jgi:Gpi18-like mannosyltransferase